MNDCPNKALYVGINVHKIRWQIAVFLDGVVLSKIALRLLPKCSSSNYESIMEMRPFIASMNVVDGLQPLPPALSAGMECIVVNPADIPGTDNERRSKTDPIDDCKITCHHAARILDGVHVPSVKCQKQRSNIRFRKKLWGDLVRAKK